MREETIGGQRLILGSCLDIMPTLEAATFDTVLTDPPYPCIKRSYGTWTEAEWHAMMDVVVPESRRVLKQSGSAVYILQPNSEKVGRMRPWLWEFMARWTREWGMVQDAWWWNTTPLPEAHSIQGHLMRPSLKACVWLGEEDCYRDQDAVLWEESSASIAQNLETRARRTYPGGQGVTRENMRKSAERRGGVSPMNVLPMSNANSTTSAGAHGHGAGTPLALCDWWLRYTCPPGGSVLEPFMGSGTVLVAAELQGKTGVGIETVPEYFDIACKRVEEATKKREADAAQLALCEAPA